jgi:hypothetical protein
MTNHSRRFSIPLDYSADSNGANGAQANSRLAAAAQNPGGMSLAQIYDFARQQAMAEVEGRKWRELFERIMQ